MKRSAQQQGYDLAVMVARAALTDENVVIPREGVSTELLQTAIMALGEIVSAALHAAAQYGVVIAREGFEVDDLPDPAPREVSEMLEAVLALYNIERQLRDL